MLKEWVVDCMAFWISFIKIIAFNWVFGKHLVIAYDLCTSTEANTRLMPCWHHLKVWIIFEQAHQQFHFALKSINYVSSLLSSSSEFSVKFEIAALLSCWFRKVPSASIVKAFVGRTEIPVGKLQSLWRTNSWTGSLSRHI